MSEDRIEREKNDEGFFSDSFSVLFNPHKFVFDFKQSTPRVRGSGENKSAESVVWHKPIVMDPVLAKKMVAVLEKNLEKYEDKFGEIEFKKQGDEEDLDAEEVEASDAEEAETEEPSYIG